MGRWEDNAREWFKQNPITDKNCDMANPNHDQMYAAIREAAKKDAERDRRGE